MPRARTTFADLFQLCVVIFSDYRISILAERTTEVTTIYGKVSGTEITLGGKILRRYLGVPYAEPPIGERRFLPAAVPAPWSGILPATRYKPSCAQGASIISEGIGDQDEDCLYLNVYAPAGENLPVMVWIHGGGLHSGSAVQYRPETMATYGEVIVVSFNYRLGVFGFSAVVGEDSEGEGGLEGNAGLRDQVLVLRWVQENIAGFGGDPERVTLYGQSAGAWSINLHMISPLSAGLFHRAICQSGAMHGLHLQTDGERGVTTQNMARSLSCPTDNSTQMLRCLQQQQPEMILQAAEQVTARHLSYLPPVTTGNAFLPLHPDEHWERFSSSDSAVDLMMGVNSDEGIIFFINSAGDDLRTYLTSGISAVDPLFDYVRNITTFLTHTPTCRTCSEDVISRHYADKYVQDTADPLQNMRGTADMFGHTQIIGPTMRTVKIASRGDKKTFLYYFNQVLPQLESELIPLETSGTVFSVPTYNQELPIGAIHGSEIPYVFGYISEELDTAVSVRNLTSHPDQSVGRSVIHAWTSFAKTG